MTTDWIAYPKPLKQGRTFDEDLSLIVQLIGSVLYEWRSSAGRVFIRRVV